MQRIIITIITLFSFILTYSAGLPSDGVSIPDDTTVYEVKSPCAKVEMSFSTTRANVLGKLYFDKHGRRLLFIAESEYKVGNFRVDTLLFAEQGFVNRRSYYFKAKGEEPVTEAYIYDTGYDQSNGPMDGIGRNFDLWVADFDKNGNWQTAYKSGEPNKGSVLAGRTINYSLTPEEEAMLTHYEAFRESLKNVDPADYRKIGKFLDDIGLSTLKPYFTKANYLLTSVIIFGLACLLVWVAMTFVKRAILSAVIVFLITLPIVCISASILGFGLKDNYGVVAQLLFYAAFVGVLCLIIPDTFRRLVRNKGISNGMISFLHIAVCFILGFSGYSVAMDYGSLLWMILMAGVWTIPALLASDKEMANRCPECHTPGTYRLVETIDAGTHTETWSDTPHTHTGPWRTKEVHGKQGEFYHERAEADTTKTTTHHIRVYQMIRERYRCSHCGYEWISDRKRSHVISHDKSTTTEKFRTERRTDIS